MRQPPVSCDLVPPAARVQDVPPSGCTAAGVCWAIFRGHDQPPSDDPRTRSQRNVNPFASLADALPEGLQQRQQPLQQAPSPVTAATLEPYAKLNRNTLQELEA